MDRTWYLEELFQYLSRLQNLLQALQSLKLNFQFKHSRLTKELLGRFLFSHQSLQNYLKSKQKLKYI